MFAAGEAPACLVLPEGRVEASLSDELFVRAFLKNLSRIQYDNSVHSGQRRKAMCNCYHGFPHHQRIQLLLNRVLRLGVERRGCFVQHQDGSVLEQRARQNDALALPSRQSCAAFAGT